MEFAIWLVNSSLNLPNGQVKFYRALLKNYYRGTVINPSQQKFFSVLVEMTLGLTTAYVNGRL